MTLVLDRSLLRSIQRSGEEAYPEEGAGLLLGFPGGGARRVVEIRPMNNDREGEARRNRYSIAALDLYQAELDAEARGMEVVGVYHSHPDHPAVPSEYDRERAVPWFSYVITSVVEGKARDSRSWRLNEDRLQFSEETIRVDSEPAGVPADPDRT